MKTEISILLPSLRPELLKRSIQEFDSTNSNVDYQIVVVSPFKVQAHKVKWIFEGEPRGSVWATNIAYTYSEGRYAVYFSDDVSPTKDCLKTMLAFMKDKETPFIGAFKMLTPEGRQIGPFGAYNKLYPCYGCLSEETCALLEGVFYHKFLYSWCDIDLAMRCYSKGGKVEICQDACVIPRQVEDDIYKNHRQTFNQDFNTFCDLWHPTYGGDLPREIGAINHKLEKC